MSFSSRLSQLMKDRNLTDNALAESIGVSRQAVSKWRNGSASPSGDKVARLAEYFEVRFDYFYQDEINPDHINYVLEESKRNRLGVPIIGSIQAGYPVQSFDTPDGFIKIESPNIMDLFALRVVGDSMLPLVMDGDVIICNKSIDNVNGKICAVTVDNESTLKRVRIDSTGVTLIPTNPMYPELHYSSKKAEELGFHVDGVLVQMIRKF